MKECQLDCVPWLSKKISQNGTDKCTRVYINTKGIMNSTTDWPKMNQVIFGFSHSEFHTKKGVFAFLTNYLNQWKKGCKTKHTGLKTRRIAVFSTYFFSPVWTHITLFLTQLTQFLSISENTTWILFRIKIYLHTSIMS